MWRRLVTSHLKTLALSSCPTTTTTAAAATRRSALTSASPLVANRSLAASSSVSSCIICRHFSSESETSVKKKVEDVMPIATGHEREELEAELEGKDILEIDHPVGPFGTKEAPAIVKSYYDKRIVGCVGGEGEDEHDTVWFWLKKGEPHECPVCSQYFVLEVAGPGGPPPGYEDDDDGH